MREIIKTKCGEVRGTSCQWEGVTAFKGIRYATAGRWEYPKLVEKWDGVYDASKYGHCSYQPRAFYDEAKVVEKAFYFNEFRKGETYTYDDDCLFLNIWKPSNATAEDRFPFWEKVMKEAGCANVAELRALDAEKLFLTWQSVMKESKGVGMIASPCVDGQMILSSNMEAAKAGRQKNIPYLMGSTSEDIVPFFVHDMAKKWCKLQAEQGKQPSYCWFFDRQLPGDKNGAWHSSELWYFFGTLKNGWRPFEEKDYEISEQMVTALCNFAKNGNPGWKAVTKNETPIMCWGEKATHVGKPNNFKLIYTMLTNKSVGE